MILFNSAKKTYSRFKKQVTLVTIVGLIGVIFLYVSASGVVSITYPWLRNQSNDQIAHIDMIYRVYNGDLPKATDGVRYQPFIDNGVGNVYQRASGHPPLFHIIMSPFMGPLLNKGEWKEAIAVGRAVNIFIGVLCILALAWAGWLFGGKRKALFAVAVPALAVMTFRYSRINTDLSMDGLLTLWATLTLINLYKILQNGLKTKYLVLLTILSVAGMSTKVSYGVFLGLSVAVVIFASYIHGNGQTRKKLLKGMIAAAAIIAITIASIGWYYYLQNYKVSGSFITPITEELSSTRPYYSYLDILTGSSFWALFYARYSNNVVISVIISTFALSGYFAMKKINLVKLRENRLHLQVVILMTLAFIGVVATQLMLAQPNGSINFRYMLPAILPISLFLAYGLLEFKWLRGQLVALAAIAMAWTTVLWVGLKPSPDGILQGVGDWPGAVAVIYKAAKSNDIPPYITGGLFLIFIAGCLLLSFSLYRLSKTRPAGQH